MGIQNKLDGGQKNILMLIQKETGSDGWAPISAILYPHVSKDIPSELAEFEKLDDGSGRVRLTELGKNVLTSMSYL